MLSAQRHLQAGTFKWHKGQKKCTGLLHFIYYICITSVLHLCYIDSRQQMNSACQPHCPHVFVFSHLEFDPPAEAERVFLLYD